MGKEINIKGINLERMNIQQLKERRTKVERVLVQRKALINRIGLGIVDVGEHTEKVGRVRAHVEDSVVSLRKKCGLLTEEIIGYDKAPSYINWLNAEKKYLAEISVEHYRGRMTGEDLEKIKQQYEKIALIPKRNPALQRGIERRMQEKEARMKKTELEGTA
jgi:hypothetical protein